MVFRNHTIYMASCTNLRELKPRHSTDMVVSGLLTQFEYHHITEPKSLKKTGPIDWGFQQVLPMNLCFWLHEPASGLGPPLSPSTAGLYFYLIFFLQLYPGI